MSFVQGLDMPFSLFPLHLVVGILVFHREGIVYGSVWFLGSSILLGSLGLPLFAWWSWILVGALGFFLVKKVITNRSVYALVGFGIIMYALMWLLNFGFPRIFNLFGLHFNVINTSFKHEIFIFILVILILYFGFVTAVKIEKISKKLFLTRSDNAY